MYPDPIDQSLAEIFLPDFVAKVKVLAEQQNRLAYYTSAETAQKILKNSELWLRNSTLMNDFLEVSYGIEIIRQGLASAQGEKFKNALQEIQPELLERILGTANEWLHDWEYETYISCVSVHDQSEDDFGRLSMWRAYGDVAIVVNPTPMLAVTDKLGVYSIPVNYFSQSEFNKRLGDIAERLEKDAEILKNIEINRIEGWLHQLFLTTAIATKHPGFSEEKEWRIFFRPSEKPKNILDRRSVVLDGIPQIVWVLPLIDDPENGLFAADIPQLLDRLIIGPSDHGFASKKAFIDILKNAGVENAEEKIIVSDIPLRTRS